MADQNLLMKVVALAGFLAFAAGAQGCVYGDECFHDVALDTWIGNAADEFCRDRGLQLHTASSSDPGRYDEICCYRSGIF